MAVLGSIVLPPCVYSKVPTANTSSLPPKLTCCGLQSGLAQDVVDGPAGEYTEVQAQAAATRAVSGAVSAPTTGSALLLALQGGE